MRTLAWITATLLLLLPACVPDADQAAQPSEVAAAPTQAPSVEPSPTDAATVAVTPAPSEPTSPPPAPVITATTKPAPDPGLEVQLWFVRDRDLLMVPEIHRISAGTKAVARETMALLIETQPRDPDLVTVIPDRTRLLGVSLENGELTVDVDFPGYGPNVGSGFEGALYDQIIHTGAQFETVDRVRVLEEGETPRTGHAIVLDEPRAPREESVAPVVVLEPEHDEHVPRGSVTVSGTANVYEATVALRLINPSGKTVKRTFATATCGTGCRGAWEHTFAKVTTPGTWKVVAGASDPSDGEGPPPHTVKRTFVVE